MFLEECPTTKSVNRFWNSKILDKFPLLEEYSDAKFLSLKEFLTDRPQKFYNNDLFVDYLSFLNDFKQNNPKELAKVLIDSEHEINVAFKSLNDINLENIHDIILPTDNTDIIQFIENKIHFNYLKLLEAVYQRFIYIIAYYQRLERDKSPAKLDIFNCTEELKSSIFHYVTTVYENTIRNGIAHGGIIYKENNTIYFGKKGKPYEIRTKRIINMFDDLLDYCNGFALAFRTFIITNRIFFQQYKINTPKQILIQEIKAQANSPRWEVIDCLESKLYDNRRQLNIFAKTKLLTLTEANYYAFRTAVLAEYFQSGYDRYYFSMKSKYSFPGFAGFDGNILRNGRLNYDTDKTAYEGVLDGKLLFYVPKIKLPKVLHKLLNFGIIVKTLFPIEFHQSTNFAFRRKYELRDMKPFRRKLSVISNGANVVIDADFTEETIKIVKTKYKKIVRYVMRKSKREINLPFSSFLSSGYIRIFIYDSDSRKRQLRNSGLSTDLVCTIDFQKSKKIKQVDIIGGKLEQKGKYRIVWNSNWEDIKHVC